MIGTRSGLRSALTVDLALLAPVRGAVTALPVVAVFVCGLVVGNTRAAVSMAIGANLIAIVSLVSAPRLSIALAVIDAFGMGFSVFVGSVTVPYPFLHTTLLVVWCFCGGMLVAFGLGEAAVGTQAVIAFLVLGRFFGTPRDALALGALVVIGALVEIFALLLLRLPPTLRFQRSRLAEAFTVLAGFARRDPRYSPADASRALDEAGRALSAPSLFGRSDARELRAMLDQAERIRLELAVLIGFRARLGATGGSTSTSTVDAYLQDASEALVEIGTALRHPRQPVGWTGAEKLSRAGVDRHAVSPEANDSQATLLVRQSLAHLDALGGQLRACENLVEKVRTGTDRHGWAVAFPRVRRPRLARPGTAIAVLRANLHGKSPVFRHAVRFAVAVPAAALLASWLALPRPYWVPFAVAVILKPDYSSLFRSGIGRVIGTLVGATLAALLVSGLHPNLLVTTVLVAVMAWAAYTSWSANFAVAIGFVTALLLILLSTSLTDTVGTAVDRLIDVLLGAAIAFVAFLVWPTSSRSGVREAESALFVANRDYLAVVVGLVEGRRVDPGRVSECSRAALITWVDAEDAIGRSVQEPAAMRTDPAKGRGLLAVALRIGRASHALRIDAAREVTVPAFEELEALSTALCQALSAVADRLAGRPHDPVAELRPLYREAASRLSLLGAPPSIALHLDELVNAVNTAVALAGPAEPLPSGQ
ncbi:MAG: FUSC family protein [Acidimicrobiales bacterium]